MEQTQIPREEKQARAAAASGPLFHRVTTRPVAPRDRLDYWRQFFVGTLIDPSPDLPSATGYRGELLRSDMHQGIAFVNVRADPNISHLGKRGSDLILLGYIRSGRAVLRQGKDTIVVPPESGLLLFDCDRPLSLSTTHHDMSCLALPRSFVAAALGADPATCGEPVFRVPGGGIEPIFRAHLDAMVAHGERLDAFEAGAAIQAAAGLATTLLAGVRRRQFEDGALDDALYAAARRCIDMHAGDACLTARQIAANLGCSRAHLYRVFAQRGQTVAGCLRDLRLRRARLLLETRPAQPIGTVAFHCGYTDLSAFGKAFRRQFGMTPSDCRQIARDKRFGV